MMLPVREPDSFHQWIDPLRPRVRPDQKTARRVFVSSRQYHAPRPDAGGEGNTGVFFEYRNRMLRRGTYVLRCHIQVAEAVVAERRGRLSIRCTRSSLDSNQTPTAEVSVPIGEELVAKSDHLLLRFSVSETADFDLRGHVTHGLGHIHLRRLMLHEVKLREFIDYTNETRKGAFWPQGVIRGLMIGTNGGCNASCALCPTNKEFREHLPTGVMTMALFRKIIDGVADSEISLGKGKIGLGLFGEPLMDPHIVDRVRYVRQRLPEVKILLNTNAGPFNERRHAELTGLVHKFSVHVEALSPEIYAELMRPLRSEVVFPKIERLIALAPRRVNIAVPLSKRNAGEFSALREYWLQRGAANVLDLSLGNRTTDSLDYYNQSLAPTPTACSVAVGHDLVIDWDGTVLACCQDFMKREPLGNLNDFPVSKILESALRKRFLETLKQGCWNSLQSCRNCKMDSNYGTA
jgi:radical SAM protein with 4Fe4S-binding SPASM domain